MRAESWPPSIRADFLHLAGGIAVLYFPADVFDAHRLVVNRSQPDRAHADHIELQLAGAGIDQAVDAGEFNLAPQAGIGGHADAGVIAADIAVLQHDQVAAARTLNVLQNIHVQIERALRNIGRPDHNTPWPHVETLGISEQRNALRDEGDELVHRLLLG